jgi:hypothetical protein
MEKYYEMYLSPMPRRREASVVVFVPVLTRNPDLWQQPGPSGQGDDTVLERQNYWDPSFGTWWPGNTVSKFL